MPINYKAYPPEWFDIIRPQVLKRDQYKCRHCGAGQRKVGYRDQSKQFVECDSFLVNWATINGKKLITIYLQVAHLDHNIHNNDLSNLLTLCQHCHNVYDGPNRGLNRMKK